MEILELTAKQIKEYQERFKEAGEYAQEEYETIEVFDFSDDSLQRVRV